MVFKKVGISSWTIQYLVKQFRTIENRYLGLVTNERTRNRLISLVNVKGSKYISQIFRI